MHISPMFYLADAWSIWAVTWAGGKHTFAPYFKAEDTCNLCRMKKSYLQPWYHFYGECVNAISLVN
ncbi:MAG: hypothetical protein U0103_11630 [Candidatus Obscuribacterales bacterium]